MVDEVLTERRLRELILAEFAAANRPLHKMNVLGRPFQRGSLEARANRKFTDVERQHAARVFDALQRNDHLVPTYSDLSDPENWLVLTDTGRTFVANGLKDRIDIALESIAEHLPEVRAGMHDAVGRTSPDATRQAINSARELLDQVLHEGAPGLETRKQRIRALLARKNGIASDKDIAIIDASARLVLAEHDKALALAHGRSQPTSADARLVVDATERSLDLLL
jgi:hypothetical protein